MLYSLFHDGILYIEHFAEGGKISGLITVTESVVVFPAVADDLLTHFVTTGIQFYFKRISPDEKIGIQTVPGSDQHPEAIPIPGFAQTEEGNSAGFEGKFIGHALDTAAFDSGTFPQLSVEPAFADSAGSCSDDRDNSRY